MDLNQLLYHHQVALIHKTSPRPVWAGSRFSMVSYYERRISRMRRDLGVTPYPDWLKAAAPASR